MTKPMKTHYYMLVNKNRKPIVMSAQLPIFWLKKVARKEAMEFKCSVVRVEILIDSL